MKKLSLAAILYIKSLCNLNRHMLNGSRIILKNVVKFSVENFESKYNLAKKVELQFQSAKLIRIVRNTQNWS